MCTLSLMSFFLRKTVPKPMQAGMNASNLSDAKASFHLCSHMVPRVKTPRM